MPEISFTVDPRTGALEVQVEGIAGPACDDIARLVKELAGESAREVKTADYFVRPTVRPQVRPEAGSR
jgi:hypothetical protein